MYLFILREVFQNEFTDNVITLTKEILQRHIVYIKNTYMHSVHKRNYTEI